MPGLDTTQDKNPFREGAVPPPAIPVIEASQADDGEDEDYIDAWEAIEAAQVEIKTAMQGLKGAIDAQDEDGVMDFLDAAFEALSMMQDALEDEDFVLDSDFNPMQEVVGDGAEGLAEAKEGYRRGTHTRRGAREHVKASGAAYEKKVAALKVKRDALVNKLKENPKVKNPEALAAWIGMRMGGLKAAKGEGK